MSEERKGEEVEEKVTVCVCVPVCGGVQIIPASKTINGLLLLLGRSGEQLQGFAVSAPGSL